MPNMASVILPISQIVPVVTQIFPTKVIPYHIKARFMPKNSISGPLPVLAFRNFDFRFSRIPSKDAKSNFRKSPWENFSYTS